MSLSQEQPPISLDPELREYLTRRFIDIENEFRKPSKFPSRKEMPYKPQIGDIHYFGNPAIHNYDAAIASVGFWGLTSIGWIQLGGAMDYLLEVGKGNVPGTTTMSAMGEFESGNINASGEDVCRSEDVGGPSRLPQPADAGEQMTIISDSTADNGATATGVITLRIEYLDASGAEQTEDIVLNGTTGVDTVATNIRFINDMYTLTVGSNGVSEGNITIYKQGGSIAIDLYNLIALGGNKSLVPHRMVPSAKTLYLMAWHCAEAQNKRAAFRLRSTDAKGILKPGVFCFKDTAYINGNPSGTLPLDSIPIPALSIVKVSYWASAVNGEGSCGWWGYLVND